MPDQRFIEVDQSAAMAFFGSPDDGPVTMLNLIKLRDRADYSHAPDLEPAGGIDGRRAYQLYVEGIEPLLVKSGGALLFLGEAESFLIGPQDEKWDLVMLVRQASKQAFLSFAEDQEAQRITAHRTAAVFDSRLLPARPTEQFL